MDTRATIHPATIDDIVLGIPLGTSRRIRSGAEPGGSPAATLVQAAGRAAGEGTCFVGFSGGCDSSLVLAAATRARRERGLPDPIAVTLRYDDPSTEERAYQQAMITHLRLREWMVIDVAGRQDLLGDSARSSLAERGVFWPATAHASGWLWDMLGPGTYLTGEGGDEVFGLRRSSPLAEVLRYAVRGHRLPTPTIARATRSSLAPAARRIQHERAQLLESYGAEWVRPDARARLLDLASRGEASEPWRARPWLERHLARRRVSIGLHNVQCHAASHGIMWKAPLLDPSFLAALATTVRWHEYRGRPIVLRHHFAELLPPLLQERTTKATFNAAFFGAATRQFAAAWDGSGLPDSVDAEWLRRNWLSSTPHAGTAMLLQSAWSAASARASNSPVAATTRGT